MSDLLQPQVPKRPLVWPDFIYDLQDMIDVQPVYIVGGAVRDAYLHRPIKDIDLVTPTNAVKLARTIADHFQGDVYVMDAERDVARVLLNVPEGALQIDVAGYRDQSLEADLRDRDFTINALAVDLASDLTQISDPLNGLDDLEARVVRQCSEDSIANDPIRTLRAVRISSLLGAKIHPETTQAIRQHGAALPRVSSERVRDEFFKMLELPRPTAALRVAQVLGILKPIFPHVDQISTDVWTQILFSMERLVSLMNAIGPGRTDIMTNVFDMGAVVVNLDRYRHQLLDHLNTEFAEGRRVSSLLLVALVLHEMTDVLEADDPAAQVERFGADLRLSNHEIQYLVKVVTHRFDACFDITRDVSILDVHRFWQEMQIRDTGVSVGLMELARYLGSVGNLINQDYWLKLVERVQKLYEAYFMRFDEIVAPTPVIDGTTLQSELKLKRGPLIGKLLTAIREAQVVGEVFTQADAIDFAKQYINANDDLE